MVGSIHNYQDCMSHSYFFFENWLLINFLSSFWFKKSGESFQNSRLFKRSDEDGKGIFVNQAWIHLIKRITWHFIFCYSLFQNDHFWMICDNFIIIWILNNILNRRSVRRSRINRRDVCRSRMNSRSICRSRMNRRRIDVVNSMYRSRRRNIVLILMNVILLTLEKFLKDLNYILKNEYIVD